MSAAAHGDGALRHVLEGARRELRCGQNKLTVLSTQVDPYRLDTPAGHRDGAWLAEQLDRLVGGERRIHWRGLHYAIVAAGDIRKPNGKIYRNTDEDWKWLINNVGRAARWLDYIDFDRIVDNRNSEPVIHRKPSIAPATWVSVGLHITIPDGDSLEPYASVTGFDGRQPYAMTIFGEKTTLDDVLHATKQGFDAMDKRFDSMDRRMDQLDIKVKMVYEVLDKWPSPSEVDDLFYRIAYIEKHLKIKRRTRKAA